MSDPAAYKNVNNAIAQWSVVDQIGFFREQLEKIKERFYRVLRIGNYYFVAYIDQNEMLGEVALTPKYDLLDSLFNPVNVDIKTFPEDQVLICWLQFKQLHQTWVEDEMRGQEASPLGVDEEAEQALKDHLTSVTVNVDETTYKE